MFASRVGAWIQNEYSMYPRTFTKLYKNPLNHTTICKNNSKKVDDFTCLETLSRMQLFPKAKGKVQKLLTFDPTQVK
jgi:hypothetical protein